MDSENTDVTQVLAEKMFHFTKNAAMWVFLLAFVASGNKIAHDDRAAIALNFGIAAAISIAMLVQSMVFKWMITKTLKPKAS